MVLSPSRGFPGGTTVIELACQCTRYELQIWSLGGEDPLEEGTATHSSILAWRIPRTEEPGGLWSFGSQRVGQDWGDLTQHIPSSVQFSFLLSRVWLFATPWTAARQASLSITNSRSLLKLMPIKSVMPSSHLILCRPLLLLPPIPPSVRVFSNESILCMRWPKYWVSASTSVLPMNTQDWSPLGWTGWISLQPKGLSSLLQHHSSKASILQHSAFFTVQLSHPYMTTGKTIALTRQTFAGKVMSLLFNMLSRLAITFLPRSKCLLISWLQSPAAVILELKKIKSATVATVSLTMSHEVMGPDAMILVFWMLSFKPPFSLYSFTFIKRPVSSSSLSAIRVVSSAYLRLSILLSAILIPACASSNPAFLMIPS